MVSGRVKGKGKGERVAPRDPESEQDEPEDEAVDEAVDEPEDEAPAVKARPATRRKVTEEEEHTTINPPLRLFALFLVPLVMLALWSIFWH